MLQFTQFRSPYNFLSACSTCALIFFVNNNSHIGLASIWRKCFLNTRVLPGILSFKEEMNKSESRTLMFEKRSLVHTRRGSRRTRKQVQWRQKERLTCAVTSILTRSVLSWRRRKLWSGVSLKCMEK